MEPLEWLLIGILIGAAVTGIIAFIAWLVYQANRRPEPQDVTSDYAYESFSVTPNIVCQGDVCSVVESHRVTGLGDDQRVRLRVIGPYEDLFTGETPTEEHLFGEGSDGLTLSPAQLGGSGQYAFFLDVTPSSFTAPDPPPAVPVVVLKNDHVFRMARSQTFRKTASSLGQGVPLDEEGGTLSVHVGWAGAVDPLAKVALTRAFCKGSRLLSLTLRDVGVETRLTGDGGALATALGTGPVSVSVRETDGSIMDSRSLSVGDAWGFAGTGLELDSARLISVAWTPAAAEVDALRDEDAITFSAAIDMHLDCPA